MTLYRASAILKNARLEKELDIADIAKKIKVPQKYLVALESEDAPNFPQEPYCSLIIKDYANFLGLNGDRLLSFFRRDFDNRRHAKSPPSHRLLVTPQFTFSLIVAVIIVIFSTYLISEYFKFNRPPNLDVHWPSSVTSEYVDISGTTDPEATVRVNQDLVIVSPDGSFSKKVKIFPDSTTKIVVESQSLSGKTTVSEKELTLSLPAKN